MERHGYHWLVVEPSGKKSIEHNPSCPRVLYDAGDGSRPYVLFHACRIARIQDYLLEHAQPHEPGRHLISRAPEREETPGLPRPNLGRDLRLAD